MSLNSVNFNQFASGVHMHLYLELGLLNFTNSNSIFIAPNLYPKTDSRRTKQKQKTVIINLRHSKGQRHGEK